MYELEITSYDDIYSIAWRFLTIKQIGDQDFSKIFNLLYLLQSKGYSHPC